MSQSIQSTQQYSTLNKFIIIWQKSSYYVLQYIVEPQSAIIGSDNWTYASKVVGKLFHCGSNA
jgi:hypothetical protein